SMRCARASKRAGGRRRSPRRAPAPPSPPDCPTGPMRSASATCSTACRPSPMPRSRMHPCTSRSSPRWGAGWCRSPTIPKAATSPSPAATAYAAAGAPASRPSARGGAGPGRGCRPEALIRGRRAPVLAVSLEHLTLDLSEVEDAAVGDAVLLLGGEGGAAIGLDEFAAWSGRRALDTVLALSGRLAAHYRGAAGGATRI
ncbi:MAG: hypothetical protein F4Y03_01710, partial [Alphaproteobacteria bacterium]|nr:hypothetical protein [Alphaproteobacteria bacterium]